MRALQMHYTSCRRGQSGGAGFQTRALSPGIRSDEQREIERHGVYRPPRDARPEPTEEEMVSELPRALRSYALASGRLALTRSCYVGRDYSGRWGNFFAHTLVAGDGEIPPLWPIDYYEWDGWRARLAPEEDREEAPAPSPLAPVELETIAAAGSFSFEEIREFLAEDPARPALLGRMGRAVLMGRETSRALVVRDTPTNGLYWIAALQKMFPRRHAWALSYSTYQDDARGCADVNASTGETDFRFDDDGERRFRFFMFDLVTGRHSEVPERADDYPAAAARWLAESGERMGAFGAFMNLFSHQRPEAQLVSAVHLFELAHGAGQAFAGERLAGMIAFAGSYATAHGKEVLLSALGSAASVPGALSRQQDWELLLPFLADGARLTGLAEHRALVFAAWSTLLMGQAWSRREHLASVEAAWNEIGSQLAGHRAELSARLLALPTWNEPQRWLAGCSAEALALLLRVTAASLRDVGRRPVCAAPEVDAIAAEMLARDGDTAVLCRPLLEAGGGEAAELVGLALLAVKAGERGTASEPVQLAVGRALARVLGTSPPGLALEIRRRLAAEQAWRLLLGEWMEVCDRAPDPLAALAGYRRTVLDALPAYASACAPWVAITALRSLPEERRPAVALDWLAVGEVDRFPPRLAGECVSLAQRAVPLDPDVPEGDAAAACVAQAAAVLGLRLEPDRPSLRRAMAGIRGSGRVELAPLLEEVRRAAPELNAADYELVVSRVLRPALERTGSRTEHQEVLLALLHPGRLDILRRSYLEFFRARRRSAWPESLQGALRFWLDFDRRTGRPEASCLAPLLATARDGLLAVLARLGERELRGVESRLRLARAESRALDAWRELVAAARRQRRRPWNRLRSLFARPKPTEGENHVRRR